MSVIRSNHGNKKYGKYIGIDVGVKYFAAVSVSHNDAENGLDRETNFKLSSIQHFHDRELKKLDKQRRHLVGGFMERELRELQSCGGVIPSHSTDLTTYIEFKLKMFNEATDEWMKPEIARIRLTAYQNKQKVYALLKLISFSFVYEIFFLYSTFYNL